LKKHLKHLNYSLAKFDTKANFNKILSN